MDLLNNYINTTAEINLSFTNNGKRHTRCLLFVTTQVSKLSYNNNEQKFNKSSQWKAVIIKSLTFLDGQSGKFLNQVSASLWPAHTWFLKIVSVWTSVCVFVCVCLLCACVCPPPRLLITSGMMWRDKNPIRLVKEVLQLLYDNCSHYC